MRGPNRAALDELGNVLAGGRDQVAKLVTQARAVLEATAGKDELVRGRLVEAHRGQEAQFRELMAKHEQEKGRAQERLQLERKRFELQERQKQRDELERQLEDRLARRRDLVQEAARLHDKRASLRRGVAERLSRDLAPTNQVRLDAGADRTAYREAVLRAFKRSGRPYQEMVKKVIAAVPPDELARCVATGAVEGLAKKAEVPLDQAARVVETLRDTPTMYELEGIALDDVPTIELWTGKEFKSSDALSTGQKCTAVLPILLLESERPLVIDQPEDNLDNAYVFASVVSKIRTVKRNRQLIFVTHNPNIPVLGDAEQVVVLSANGETSAVAAAGAVDEVKEHIARILEGGRDAFEQRKLRYGY